MTERKALVLIFLLATLGAGIAFFSVALSAHYSETRGQEASEKRWNDMRQRASSPQARSLVEELHEQCSLDSHLFDNLLSREERCVQNRLDALRLYSESGGLALDEVQSLGSW